VCLLFDLAVFCLWFLLWGFVPNYEMGSSFNWRVVTVEFGNESFNSSKKKKKKKKKKQLMKYYQTLREQHTRTYQIYVEISLHGANSINSL
jgi:hypothetical protein